MRSQLNSLVRLNPLHQDGGIIDKVSATFDRQLLQLKPKRLPPLAKTRDLIHIYGIKAKGNLSQNFLLNPKLLRGLVKAAGISPGHRVVEVGPGPGNLTRAILERSPFEVIAIEKDRRFMPLLEQLADSVLPSQFKIFLGDALEHDLTDIFGDPKQLSMGYNLVESLPEHVLNFSREWDDSRYPLIRVIGNLPFSVSTPLLIRWLHQISLQKGIWQYGRVPMLLTFQEEVARRITAQPTASEWTRLSAMSQNYCHVEYKFTISGKSFTPNAAVDTGVVRFHPRIEPICKVPFKVFEKFIRHLFHHRNHNLQYNYGKLFPRDMRELANASLETSRVNPRIYPYMASIREIGRLCDQYYEQCQLVPPLIEYDYRAGRKLATKGELEILKSLEQLE